MKSCYPAISLFKTIQHLGQEASSAFLAIGVSNFTRHDPSPNFVGHLKKVSPQDALWIFFNGAYPLVISQSYIFPQLCPITNNYQRVHPIKSHENISFSYALPPLFYGVSTLKTSRKIQRSPSHVPWGRHLGLSHKSTWEQNEGQNDSPFSKP